MKTEGYPELTCHPTTANVYRVARKLTQLFPDLDGYVADTVRHMDDRVEDGSPTTEEADWALMCLMGAAQWRLPDQMELRFHGRAS